MTEPISPEQLAELEEGAGFCRYGRDADMLAKAMVGEIRSLRDRVERAEQTIANSAEIITARDKRIRELEGELNEITDLDRSALKTQELRDERAEAVRKWHDEHLRAERAERAEQLLREVRALADAATTYADWHLLAEHLRDAAAPDRAERNEQ